MATPARRPSLFDPERVTDHGPVIPTLSSREFALRQALQGPSTARGLEALAAQTRGIGTPEQLRHIAGAVLDMEALGLSQRILVDKLSSHVDSRALFCHLLGHVGGTAFDEPAFARACEDLGVPVAPGTFAAFYRSVDIDGDGLIDYNDIVHFLEGREPLLGFVPNLAAGPGTGVAVGPARGLWARAGKTQSAAERGGVLAQKARSSVRAEAAPPVQVLSTPVPSVVPAAASPQPMQAWPSSIRSATTLPLASPGGQLDRVDGYSRELELQITLAKLRAWVSRRYHSPRAAFLALRNPDLRAPVLRLDDFLDTLDYEQAGLPEDDISELFGRFAVRTRQIEAVVEAVEDGAAQGPAAGPATQPGQHEGSQMTAAGFMATDTLDMSVNEFLGLVTGLMPAGSLGTAQVEVTRTSPASLSPGTSSAGGSPGLVMGLRPRRVAAGVPTHTYMHIPPLWPGQPAPAPVAQVGVEEPGFRPQASTAQLQAERAAAGAYAGEAAGLPLRRGGAVESGPAAARVPRLAIGAGTPPPHVPAPVMQSAVATQTDVSPAQARPGRAREAAARKALGRSWASSSTGRHVQPMSSRYLRTTLAGRPSWRPAG